VSGVFLLLGRPLAAKTIGPVLGGSLAVWDAALVVVQAALGAGEAYAHGSISLLGIKRAARMHVQVTLAAIALLPIGLSEGTPGPQDVNPVVWLIRTLAVMVGGPFFVLAATSSLLQRWFAASGHRTSHNPYWLYAASNAGSLLALFAFPTLVEPFFTLPEQTGNWSIGYGLFALLMVGSAVTVVVSKRGLSEGGNAAGDAAADEVPITWKRRLRWVALSAIPSALMLGVTQHITTDIAAVPLLWVIPLGLYLLTFIIAFGGTLPIRERLFDFGVVVVTLALVAEFLTRAVTFSRAAAVIHLFGFFVLALHTHAKLAKDRPAAQHVTEFFLFVAVGGVVGGFLTAIVSPLIFSEVLEYPIALALALAFRNAAVYGRRESARSRFVLPKWLPAMPAMVAIVASTVIAFGIPWAVAIMYPDASSVDVAQRLRAVVQTGLAFVVVVGFSAKPIAVGSPV